MIIFPWRNPSESGGAMNHIRVALSIIFGWRNASEYPVNYHIEAQTPEPTGKGTKPRITWEQYLSSVTKPSFRDILKDFHRRWIDEIDDSINTGQVGFSVGIEFGGKRLPMQYIYDNRIGIISEKAAKNISIPTPLYEKYMADLKQSGLLYDKYISRGKVEVLFSDIDDDTLLLILDSTIRLAKSYKNNYDA